MECVSLKFKTPPKSIDEVKSVLENYKSHVRMLQLHSSPEKDIYVLNNNERPQPRMDIMKGKGYAVSIGRLRSGKFWDVQFTLLSHNT